MTRTRAVAPTGTTLQNLRLPIPTNIALQILQLLSTTDLARFRTMSVEYGDIILSDKFIESNILRNFRAPRTSSTYLDHLKGYAGDNSSFGQTFL
ncbi:hypothetical protein ACFX2C_000798 [Malus domestica]